MITATYLAWYIAFTFFLAGLAWYPCGCGESVDEWCELCLSPEYEYPDTLSLTLAGVENGRIWDGAWVECNCTVGDYNHNGTWILSPPELIPCSWSYGLPFICQYHNVATAMRIYVDTVDKSGSDVTRIRAEIQTNGTAEWVKEFANDNPIDCAATYDFDDALPDSYSNSMCVWEDATCQIN